MWKTALLLSSLVLFTGSPALAGWHHHHAYYAAPAYYYPAAAAPPQEAPTSQLADLLLPIFADALRARIGQRITQPPPTVTTPDLDGLRSDLAQLAAAIENTNATLQRHGQELASQRLDTMELRNEVAAIKSLVDATSTIQKDLKDILDKLPKQTKQELLAALSSNELFKAVNAQNKLDADEKAALIEELKKEIGAILARHYGEAN